MYVKQCANTSAFRCRNALGILSGTQEVLIFKFNSSENTPSQDIKPAGKQDDKFFQRS